MQGEPSQDTVPGRFCRAPFATYQKETMWLSLRNALALLGSRDPERWSPLLGVYYLTYACRFRCSYCSDGAGKPYHRLVSDCLQSREVLALLATLRRSTDYLVLTGGEPLEHPELREILLGLPQIGYDGVVLTTNGDGIHRILKEVAQAIRYLVFSLDTLDPIRGDAGFGAGPGTLARVLDEIEGARRFPGAGYEIIISSVATPTGISDLYSVYDYCKDRGFRFAVCPQLVGVKAHAELHGHTEYRRFLDFLIAEKKRGEAVNGTVEYLEHMKELQPFTCIPSSTVAIQPNGDVFYPCLERGTVGGNLFAQPDLNAIRRQARGHLGSEPTCGNQCHSACALSFALLLGQPWSVIREGWLMARGGLARSYSRLNTRT